MLFRSNSAKDKQSGQWVANAPDATFTGGAIYNLQGWYASLLDKWVGHSYGAGATGNVAIGSFSTLDGAVGYTVPAGSAWLAKANFKLSFNNLLDSHKIIALAGTTAGNNPTTGNPDNLFWVMPERSVFATVSVPF